MRKYKNQKFNLILILVILLVLGIGVGYSALTEKLYIDGSVAIKEMKWDVGFSAIEDNGGTVLSESSISEDGKTLTVLCDFGSNTIQKTCITKATITNNSTFDVGIISNPSIKYNSDYIHTLTFKWNNHSTYENKTVLKDNFIAKGTSEEVILTIKSKFLSKDNLPSQNTKIPVTITLNFGEWQQDTLPTKNDLAVLKSTTIEDTTAFRSSTYKEKIKTITIENKINIPESATESWDIGVNSGKVMAYVVPNETDSTYYNLYIQSDGQLYANKDMSWWFANLTYVDSIKGLKLLDTCDVTDMKNMFYSTGYNSSIFTLDVSGFDTSNANIMAGIFQSAGFSNPTFTLDVSNLDTSNVTNMSNMFYLTGYNSTKLILDVSNFDTSKATNMSYMFSCVGYENSNFTLDVSNFDTSNVTDMKYMFKSTGYNSKVFTLDLSDFNTSNVTNMNGMFLYAGTNCAAFTLDISNFDTSKVTDMGSMFQSTGYSNPNFTLDISNLNTSNVTNMNSMFLYTGLNSNVLNLDVRNFDTSKVIDMSNMFDNAGYNSAKLNTSITIKNPNTTYDNLFRDVATKEGTQIIVNYTSETSNLVDAMIATKSYNSNVVKGIQVN